jgi:hypothetical protein
VLSALATHGVGGSTDLPIPFLYAMVGASWALTISFAVLALAWREPKFDGDGAGAGDGDGDAGEPEPPPRRAWLGVVGALLAAWFLLVLFFGPDELSNGGLGAFYVLVWVGLVPLALLAGHVWRDLSPWRSIQAAVGRLTGRPDGFRKYPAGLGYWPAVAGVFAFVWLELASPDAGDINTVRAWVAVYVVVTVAGGIVFGPRWFDRADPFDVYSAVVARLSPFVRQGHFALHNPLRSLPRLPVHPGLVALLATLLGSTAYDSFSASAFWQSKSLGVVERSLTLAGFCVVVALLFQLASRATGGVSPEERAALPGRLAHSLVPIVVGYVFAHYLTYLVEKGQAVVLALTGAEGQVSYVLSTHTSLLAVLKVSFVVLGHVLAVVAAHDRALVLLPRAHRLSGQMGMLLLMVAYTFTGLFLLFSV